MGIFLTSVWVDGFLSFSMQNTGKEKRKSDASLNNNI